MIKHAALADILAIILTQQGTGAISFVNLINALLKQVLKNPTSKFHESTDIKLFKCNFNYSNEMKFAQISFIAALHEKPLLTALTTCASHVFRTELEITKSTSQVDHKSELFFIGSCFSEAISRKLNDRKFYMNVNPQGIMFNPLSIA